MKKYSIIGLALASLTVASLLSAATLPGSIDDDFLAVGNPSRFTVGVNYESIRRQISPDTGNDFRMDATSVSLYVGYDALKWLTVFGTIGGTENNTDFELGKSDDSQFKWSIGANVNLYKWYLQHPAVMTGDRITVRIFAEYAGYEADTGIGNMDWGDAYIAMPIAYERYERNDRISDDSELFRISIYAGPMASLINGSLDTGNGSTDFDAANNFGLIGGIDIYFTSSISIGGQIQMFDTSTDDISANGSLRYHF